MSAIKDPVEVTFVEERSGRAAGAARNVAATSRPVRLREAATARLHAFDQNDQPLITGLAELPGEIVAARSTIRLSRSQVGAAVVLVFEQGDVRRPIVLGLLQEQPLAADAADSPARPVSVQADDDHVLLSAERQITLRCGEASITLTRAGKVVIRGAYVVSRSTGCNKIKGAVVDIN